MSSHEASQLSRQQPPPDSQRLEEPVEETTSELGHANQAHNEASHVPADISQETESNRENNEAVRSTQQRHDELPGSTPTPAPAQPELSSVDRAMIRRLFVIIRNLCREMAESRVFLNFVPPLQEVPSTAFTEPGSRAFFNLVSQSINVRYDTVRGYPNETLQFLIMRLLWEIFRDRSLGLHLTVANRSSLVQHIKGFYLPITARPLPVAEYHRLAERVVDSWLEFQYAILAYNGSDTFRFYEPPDPTFGRGFRRQDLDPLGVNLIYRSNTQIRDSRRDMAGLVVFGGLMRESPAGPMYEARAQILVYRLAGGEENRLRVPERSRRALPS
ncbi:hypothetical protein FDECE_4689 [Fusarium decemcellulare]|nr:hypothetical protein FDECE_4689 [Fusarium decemcellulare]